jgi:hypothetical protein
MNTSLIWAIDDYLTLVSIILVSVGGIFALYQWSSAEKLKKAELLDKIINTLRFDNENAETMSIIDYDSNSIWYNKEFHKNKDLERKIDKLLSYCNYICYLYSTANISEKEFRMLEYKIKRICSSSNVQAYLWNLHHFSTKTVEVECSFMRLIDYGIEKKLMNDEFKSNSTNLFEKNLNF